MQLRFIKEFLDLRFPENLVRATVSGVANLAFCAAFPVSAATRAAGLHPIADQGTALECGSASLIDYRGGGDSDPCLPVQEGGDARRPIEPLPAPQQNR